MRLLMRIADQLKVFRHDHIPQHHEPVTPAHPLQNLQEQITVKLVSEKGEAPVTD